MPLLPKFTLPPVLAALALSVCGMTSQIAAAPPVSQWDQAPKDKFGGSTAIQLDATGFFRMEQVDGKWWFITPEGHPFLAFGALHCMPQKMMQPYNREHWKARLGLKENDSQADLAAAHRKLLKQEFDELGLNWTGIGWYPKPNDDHVNYIYTVRMTPVDYYRWPKAKDFPDVFSSEYERYCDEFARREVLPRANDSRAIAFALGDCPVLIDQEARPHEKMINRSASPESPTWPRVLRNLGADAPGKHAYVKTMQSIYSGSIERFNHTYKTIFASWDELIAAENWRPEVQYRSNSREVRDNLDFLKIVLERRYKVEVRAVRRFAPNHLICGDKFNQNAPLPIELFSIWDKHFDFMWVQFYGDWYDLEKRLDKLSPLTEKPFFLADACWSVQRPPHQPFPRGPHCANDEVCAQMAREAFDGAFARPDFIGWGWCGWIDMRRKENDPTSHPGYQDEFGNYYKPVTDEFRRFSNQMYGLHVGGGQ